MCRFFFFKQKTAYEMRISDWSSDVCSSDLLLTAVLLDAPALGLTHWGRAKLMHRAGEYAVSSAVAARRCDGTWSCWIGAIEAGPAPMPRCETLLNSTPHPAPAALPACALEDVRTVCPDASPPPAPKPEDR